MTRLYGVVILAILLCSAPLRAEQQPPPVAGADAPLPLDSVIGALLQQHRIAEAEEILAPLLREQPKSPQLQFLSGLVAMEKGEPRQAVRLFRAILIDHPKAERVRLELGRAFFVAGDYGNAARQFQFARAGNVPEAVRANIDRYLYTIRQAKSLSYNLDIAVAPDTNLNGGSASREVTLYGLPFDLSDDARQRSGVGLSLAASGEWAPRLSRTTRLRMGASIFRREYSGAEFDDMTLAAYAGPRIVLPRWDLSLLATASRRWYGAEPYNAALGGRLAVTYYAKPQLSLTTEIAVQSVNYRQAPHMSGTLASASETVVYSLTPSSGTTAKAGVSRQTARSRGFANWNGYLAAGYFRELPAGFSAYAEASVSFASYDEALPSFGKRRVDVASGVMVNLLNRHIVLSRFTPRLTYTFTRQRSTIPLYSFDRNRFEMGLTTAF